MSAIVTVYMTPFELKDLSDGMGAYFILDPGPGTAKVDLPLDRYIIRVYDGGDTFYADKR